MAKDVDLSLPLSDEARAYLISRGQDWRIRDLDLNWQNQQNALRADQDGVEVDEEDDYNDWKVAELRDELDKRRSLQLQDVEDDELIVSINQRLSSDGKKDVLVSRLEADDAASNAGNE